MRFFYLVILAFLFTCIGFTSAFFIVESKHSLIKINKDFSTVSKILSESSLHKYVDEEYMCMDFSRDVVQKLTEHGYRSRIVIGQNPSQEDSHSWISVEFDPQTGKLMRDKSYKYTTSCTVQVDGKLDCENGRVADNIYYRTSLSK